MKIPLQDVKNLYYKEGLSAKEVGKKLDASVWQVIKFMKRNNLPRRDHTETRRLAFISALPSFEAKSTLTTEELELKIAGLMLYWGEGVKTSDNTVDITNSDPLMIKIFLKMLREIYGVQEKKLRVLLYCYANQNVDELISYWVKVTGISEYQFTKPYVRRDFLETKQGKMPHGLVHIRYADKKLVIKVREDTKDLLNKFLSC